MTQHFKSLQQEGKDTMERFKACRSTRERLDLVQDTVLASKEFREVKNCFPTRCIV